MNRVDTMSPSISQIFNLIIFMKIESNHQFQDSFEFMVANAGRDTVRNRSEIVVRSLVIPQPVIVEANTTTPITSSQLNASALEVDLKLKILKINPKIINSSFIKRNTFSKSTKFYQFQGATPRFLVATPPKYGRVTLDPTSSHSALYFTNNDITKGKVLYQAFGSRDEVI